MTIMEKIDMKKRADEFYSSHDSNPIADLLLSKQLYKITCESCKKVFECSEDSQAFKQKTCGDCFDKQEKENSAVSRRYKRGERGLESMERRMLESTRMQRLIAKLSEFYGVQLKAPKFVPVFISKRLKRHDGLHYTSKIVIDYCSTKSRWLMWHEVMHSVVGDNWGILWEECKNQGKTLPSYQSFEKQVFRFGTGDGAHGSQNWKLSCECGQWVKTVQKKKTWTCPRCNIRLVSKNEYQKLKKIASIGSTTLTFDINKYKPWKSNERIA